MCYDLNFKVAVINYALEHGQRAAGKEFNIAHSMVTKSGRSRIA